MLDIQKLPHDPEALQRLVIEQHRQIEHLKFQIAKLRRFRFGQSSEQLESAGQMPLTLEELTVALVEAQKQSTGAGDASSDTTEKPVRRKTLPEHFHREDNVIPSGECSCPDCGGPLR